MTALSAAVVALVGWFVPVVWARVLPEGARPLMLNAVLSTIGTAVVVAVLFALLYWVQGMPASALNEAGVVPVVVHFGRLSVSAGLIWVPIMILSLANLPRRWVKERW